MVPGLIEWPARIPAPRRNAIRACTSDLLPTLCALVGATLPDRPLDGIDLTPALDGRLNERPQPLCFWEFDTGHLDRKQLVPWIDPELQKGTTPLAKLMGGKATRDFTNFRHPAITDDDYRGPRAVIDGRFKLVVHERTATDVKRELFDLDADPAEKTNLVDRHGEVADRLGERLRRWQASVLNSLTGADYAR